MLQSLGSHTVVVAVAAGRAAAGASAPTTEGEEHLSLIVGVVVPKGEANLCCFLFSLSIILLLGPTEGPVLGNV